MTGTHRTLRLTAEVVRINGRDVVLATDHKGGIIAARVLGSDRPTFVAQQIRREVEKHLNEVVLQKNAMAGDLVEQAYRVECIFLGGAE
jgi:hypothetical protein